MAPVPPLSGRLPWGFDGAAALEVTGDEPAKDRPKEADRPAGEDVGGIMDAEVDAAEPNDESEQGGNGEDVNLLTSMSDKPGHKSAKGEINNGGEKSVAARKAVAVHVMKVRNQIGPFAGEVAFQRPIQSEAAAQCAGQENESGIFSSKQEKARDNRGDEAEDGDTSQRGVIANAFLDAPRAKGVGGIVRAAERAQNRTVDFARFAFGDFVGQFNEGPGAGDEDEKEDKDNQVLAAGPVPAVAKERMDCFSHTGKVRRSFFHRPVRGDKRFVAAREGPDVFVTHALRDVGREGGTKTAAAIHDQLGVRIADGVLDVALEHAFAEVNRLPGVAIGPFGVFPDIDENGVGILFQTFACLLDGEFADARFGIVHNFQKSG